MKYGVTANVSQTRVSEFSSYKKVMSYLFMMNRTNESNNEQIKG